MSRIDSRLRKESNTYRRRSASIDQSERQRKIYLEQKLKNDALPQNIRNSYRNFAKQCLSLTKGTVITDTIYQERVELSCYKNFLLILSDLTGIAKVSPEEEAEINVIKGRVERGFSLQTVNFRNIKITTKDFLKHVENYEVISMEDYRNIEQHIEDYIPAGAKESDLNEVLDYYVVNLEYLTKKAEEYGYPEIVDKFNSKLEAIRECVSVNNVTV